MVAGAIRSLVNARDLQLQWATVVHETFLVSLFRRSSRIIVHIFCVKVILVSIPIFQ